MAAWLSFTGVSHAQTYTEGGKDWKMTFGTNFVYDSNLVAAPTQSILKPTGISKVDATGVNMTASGIYNLNISKDLQLNVNYDLDHVIYDGISGYDLNSQMFGTGMLYKFTPLITMGVDYKYIYNILSGDRFSGIQFVDTNLSHMHPDYGLTRIDFMFKDTDNFQFNSRDGQTYTGGIAHYLFFSNYTRRLSISYKYNVDDMHGINNAFQRTYHDVQAAGSTPLFYGINFNGLAKYSIRNYENFLVTSVTLREDVQQYYQAAFTKVLVKSWGYLQNLTAQAKYEHMFNNSNLGVRTYVSDRYSIGLTATF